ncbi:MAG: hypothetical protein WA876_06795 [Candidatus Acidiferrales bacterium]
MKTVTVALYVCAGAACALLCSPLMAKWGGSPPSRWHMWGEPAFWAAFVAPAAFLLGAILVIFKRRLGWLAGLIAAGIALRFFLPWEMYDYRFVNSWVLFNEPGPARALIEPTVRLVAIILVIVAIIYSLLRLTPARWRIAGKPVCERSWLVFAVLLPILCAWYFTAVSPYRVPIYDLYGNRPLFRVVHVEKHGLHFHETSVIVARDGRFWLLQDERRLFQYSFEETGESGDVPAESMEAIDAVIHSGRYGNSGHSRNVSPWTWNADRWFVYSELPPVWSFTNTDAKQVPQQIVDWFSKTQGQTKQDGHTTSRDVCLGFCFFQGPPLIWH